ncbi:SPOR domain-containing protein [Pseudomonas helleri]|uniref:SPOR domain-containing protein n=1 Tax=Pseudomonas helleri TaxID=1608996 RepID=A0A6A7YYN7_9PSED|nr:SPOR domain-containing protein [Pseudomonas helleri]MQT28376.1 SPOR domain-containing protein [Pseudomonas helleri]MQT81503.1 SPOR domain-containing protein [Pseudomonas helleri]MQU16433.1 SPOR domain-containing protein [Pseudomonas helleri]MQU27977.1 SPOR domain-containing protein [Pseudomonas helleri]
MALLDKVYKQRMVGALVLVALAVIFLPMLFNREDEQRQIQVDVPTAPQVPVMPQVQVEPVPVPEPQPIPEEPAPPEEVAPVPAAPAPAAVVSKPVAAVKTPAVTPAQTVAQAPAKLDTTQKRVDANGLPVSWSVQLVSLSNRASADNLQKTLRNQGYNAYVRSSGGMNRVFVGPLLERAEADRLRDLLGKQQNLKGFVVRFQPERG